MPKKTALYDEHVKNKARIVDFAGWAMPIQYRSVIKEHEAVRQDCGMFDCGHMGSFLIEGPDAVAYVDYLITNNLSQTGPGRCVYTPLLYENGTFVDDIICYYLDREKVFIIVNSANIDKDREWFTAKLKEKAFNARFRDVSARYLNLAVQGAAAWSYIQKIFPALQEMPSFTLQEVTFNNEKMNIAATGYTGEKGVEIFVPVSQAPALFNAFLEAGVTPCGLGARDSLRLEKGLSLYGHEISDKVNPVEAMLKWTVDMSKDVFIGKEAVAAAIAKGKTKKLTGFVMEDKGIARHNYTVYDLAKQPVGTVTSGTFAPSLKKNIGLAYIPADYSDKKILINVRGKYLSAALHKRKFI